MDNLFELLKTSGSGCIIGNYYAGCFGYADDLFFLCPSRKGLQEMLNISEKYVTEHSISFSTNTDPTKSKTKGMIFSRRPLKFDPEPLLLNGNPLPWVKKAKYLGNVITDSPDGLKKDAQCKRAQYIERNIEIIQEFPFAHPALRCKINRIYNSSFPGSVLYDLTSDSVSQLVNSWSVSVRHMWGLPLQTHRYLIEPLGGEHAFTMLTTRFVNFLQNIQKSPKLAVQYMLQKVLNNVNTVTGKNVRTIQDIIGHEQDILSVKSVWLKKKIKFSRISEDNIWRVNMIKEIIDIKQRIVEVTPNDEEDSFLSTEQFEEILDFISKS